MEILFKKAINKLFLILFHEAFQDFKTSFGFKLFVLSTIGIFTAIAIWALIYFS